MSYSLYYQSGIEFNLPDNNGRVIFRSNKAQYFFTVHDIIKCFNMNINKLGYGTEIPQGNC